MPPVLHDNHLMRFVPLVPSEIEPGPWRGFLAVELAWRGHAHAAWAGESIDDEIHVGSEEAARQPVDHGIHLHAGILIKPTAGLNIDLLACG